jgi:hypothetical protein
MIKIQEILYDKLRIDNILTVEMEIKGVKHQFQSLFRLRGLLGTGSFGIVVEVLNLKTNEINALKILHS